MRRLLAILILLCILYFAGGWVAVQLNFLEESTYFSFAGLVGGLASVLGLLSFTKPALTKSDLQEIEIESIQSIAKTTEELGSLEKERATTKKELGALAVQKKEMELLVKKASLALFLQEQHTYLEDKIRDVVDSNSELKESLLKIQEISEKMSLLDTEIEQDSNVEKLKEVLAAASKKQSSIDDVIEELPIFTKFLFLFARDVGKAMTGLFSAIK